MHQYPSETIHRRLRNRFKVFLVHYGNYLESFGLKEWRKISQEDIDDYTNQIFILAHYNQYKHNKLKINLGLLLVTTVLAILCICFTLF